MTTPPSFSLLALAELMAFDVQHGAILSGHMRFPVGDIVSGICHLMRSRGWDIEHRVIEVETVPAGLRRQSVSVGKIHHLVEGDAWMALHQEGASRFDAPQVATKAALARLRKRIARGSWLSAAEWQSHLHEHVDRAVDPGVLEGLSSSPVWQEMIAMEDRALLDAMIPSATTVSRRTSRL